MNASQQVKEFCKQNRINLNSANRIPMLSVMFLGGAMWVECFDNYPSALEFITKHINAYRNTGVATPWSTPNTK